MTSDEYRAICERCGISPYRFAELCGAAPGSRPGWSREGGLGPVPPAVAMLARLMEAVQDKITYAEMAERLRDEAEAFFDM